MTFHVPKTVSIAAIALSLAACSGGGDDPTPVQTIPTYVPFTDQNSTAVSALDGDIIDINGTISNATGGNLDRSDDSFTLGALSGSLDPNGGSGTLAGGGTVTITDLDDYVAAFMASPSGQPSVFGVTGTPTGDMAGAPVTATFNGSSSMIVNDGSDLWTLNGTSTAMIDFNQGIGSATMTNLDGVKSGLTGATNVTNAGSIEIPDITLNGNRFTATKVFTLLNGISASPSNSATRSAQGGFYGPDAAAIGGVFQVDDTNNGSYSLQGAFAGSR